MQSVEEILGKLETADNTTKNRIENILLELAKLLLNILKKLLIITKILNGLQNTLFLKLKA